MLLPAGLPPGRTANGSNEVSSWESRSNKNGDTFTLTTNSGTPTLVSTNSDFGDFPTIRFDGSSKMYSADFNGFNDVESFTRIFVMKINKGVKNESSSIL